MSVELTALTLCAILASSLWIPYIAMSGRPENAPHQSFERMPNVAAMSDVAQRAYRAHLNLIEQFVPYAVVILVAHLSGVSNVITVWASVLFVVLRVLHAWGFIAGWARMPLRPLLFTGGWLCVLAIAGAVLVS